MNSSVIYVSKTGHSKKIAEALGKELHIPVVNVVSNPEIKATDLLFIVAGIYGGKSDPKLLEYVGNLDSTKVKKAVLITSCTSKTNKQDMVREILKKKGIEVHSDEFICQGSFLFFGLGHPNAADITRAVSFSKEILNS